MHHSYNPQARLKTAFGFWEKPLINALQTNFATAVHVLGTRHQRNTFKVHFKSLSVPETIQEEMLNDVFGATWNDRVYDRMQKKIKD